uniref:Uncharacterized protein n=1 Tax=Anopheles christyi TaxID=43041 RepID=A0A182KD90_9DIPT
MTYDMQGDLGITRHHAALNQGPLDDTEYKRTLNVEAAVKYWLGKGAAASKLTLGVPLYGRSFKLTNPKVDGLGAPISGIAKAGEFTREAGSLAYYEICSSTSLSRKQFDSVQIGAYASGNGEWVSYDNVDSVGQKCNVIAKYGVAGGMVWSIDMDDFAGRCGIKFPLLTALNSCVNRNAPVVTIGTTTGPTARPATTMTTKAVTPNSGPFVCPRDGFFRDPKNCAKYYRCYDGGRQALLDCPSGLYFNEAIPACDWPYNVTC